jgi:DNA-binding NtrC family response regulator
MDVQDTATHTFGQVQTLDTLAFELSVQAGPDQGLHFEASQGKARIGTAKGSDIELRDQTVSRIHCELFTSREGLRVRDCGSKNGTFVDGVPIYEAALLAGATLRVGQTTLRVNYGSEQVHLQISPHGAFGPLVGASVDMRRIYTILERVAPTQGTVLIQGETGTGKELVARAIHEASPRAAEPFVTVDCGALAESLIESELFGHVRGSFTGAHSDRPGLFEQAHRGTLFLDEIGELPLSLQPRLLRVLESREVRRVGANRSTAVDVRVLAATHQPLERSVNEGRFREDLYYRLAVVELRVPPLRARPEDIPHLAMVFYERFSDGGTMPEDWGPILAQKSWPGNVRELRNFVERSLALGWTPGTPSGPASARGSVPPAGGSLARNPLDLPLKEARAEWGERFELEYLMSLMRRTAGNVTRASELAGVNRRTLQRMLASYPAHFPR